MKTQIQLAHGIEAAKNGDKAKAKDFLYKVLDVEPDNETAWTWLSYVVDSAEDRQVCLENVLIINPLSQYAKKGLAQLAALTKTQSPDAKLARKKALRTVMLNLSIAFWVGLGFLLCIVGIIEVVNRLFDLITSRTFPYYITPSQLWTFTIAVSFLIAGIIVFNIAWALYVRHKAGFFAGIIVSLALTLIAPTLLLIVKSSNYLPAAFAAIMPIIVLFLILMSQTGFENE